MSSKERWRPVVGWEGYYEVSDHGRVRSVDRVTVNRNGVERLLRGKMRVVQTTTDTPYVALSRDGKQRNHGVAHLVLTAFVGPRPDDLTDAHVLDSDPTNLRLANLVWTKRKDIAAKFLPGRRPQFFLHEARLAKEIERRYRRGCSVVYLARAYKVGRATIRAIINGSSRKYSTEDERREAVRALLEWEKKRSISAPRIAMLAPIYLRDRWFPCMNAVYDDRKGKHVPSDLPTLLADLDYLYECYTSPFYLTPKEYATVEASTAKLKVGQK